jgi:hypothetical protein
MKRLALAVLLLSGAFGCAGARAEVVAPTAKYPISLTHAVRGADGALVPNSKRKVVGDFEDGKTAFAILYSGVRLTSALDLSDAVNEQVSAAGGNAVVDLQVSSKYCALDWFIVLHLIPIWPGCQTVRATGKIVQVTGP